MLASILALFLNCASSGNRQQVLPQIAASAPDFETVRLSTPMTWKSLVAGRSTTLGVKQNGSLWMWGWNGQGSAGDGRLERSVHIEGGRPPVALPPTRIGTDSDWASVSAGEGSLMAIKTNGTLWRFAHANGGRSVDADPDETTETPAQPATPSAVPVPQQLGTDADWVQVSTARSHTLGVRSDGSLWGWGLNMNGELGDGTREERRALVRIGKELWRTVVTASLRTAGIRANGTLCVWGWRARGGDREDEVATSPIQLGGDSDWAQLSFSGGHLLAIKTDGSLWSYGSNDHGELGLGKAPRSNGYALARVGSDSDWVMARAGDDFSVAIKRDGSLWSWGTGYQGQLGDDSNEDRLSPARIAKDIVWRMVAVGDAHVIAEAADGSTFTWGDNHQGQLGDGHNLVALLPVQVQPGRTWRFVAGDELSTIALGEDGTMWTWGSSAEAAVVKSPTEWKALAHYQGGNVVGIAPDGSLWDIWWHKDKPEKIERDPWNKEAAGARWTRLTGTKHGVVVQDEHDGLFSLGRVQISGRNGATDREIWQPRPLGKAGGWSQAFAEVAPGAVLAQKKNGTLWLFTDAWMNKPPVQVDKNTHWERIIAGESELLLLGQDGKLWRFDGERKERIGTSTWQTASVSSHHTLAIRKDGSLWSWGEGDAGELGTVYAGEQPSPVRVGTASDWAQVFAASNHSLAIKRDGSLWAWGNNLNGELGIAPSYRKLPVKLVIP